MQALQDPKSGIFQLRGVGGHSPYLQDLTADRVFVSRSVSVFLSPDLYLYFCILICICICRTYQLTVPRGWNRKGSSLSLRFQLSALDTFILDICHQMYQYWSALHTFPLDICYWILGMNIGIGLGYG